MDNSSGRSLSADPAIFPTVVTAFSNERIDAGRCLSRGGLDTFDENAAHLGVDDHDRRTANYQRQPVNRRNRVRGGCDGSRLFLAFAQAKPDRHPQGGVPDRIATAIIACGRILVRKQPVTVCVV
jgi:hypothetical protein